MSDSLDSERQTIAKMVENLGKYYDSVQIFCTRHDVAGAGGTVNLHVGLGNWFETRRVHEGCGEAKTTEDRMSYYQVKFSYHNSCSPSFEDDECVECETSDEAVRHAAVLHNGNIAINSVSPMTKLEYIKALDAKMKARKAFEDRQRWEEIVSQVRQEATNATTPTAGELLARNWRSVKGGL